ncbi:hypothetical protein MNEG_14400 [Monoraphidium neglectum]|uniref:Uncharacterized protein n=1 Tax=Monoraphidium neglectum TaxID=145388 RepID=A0A0D2KCJ6_9CHLO|nr:hypothetical protein MNEG_14400 [Monoraphidium neglectum]KIY93563.1 hypothetical protein MNEG_14400 [Monoraphidium neglectum]|eukprot:XP_013892583.1 hypothetical protein MNEG_14400 [Monoraphidium neglectum]
MNVRGALDAAPGSAARGGGGGGRPARNRPRPCANGPAAPSASTEFGGRRSTPKRPLRMPGGCEDANACMPPKAAPRPPPICRSSGRDASARPAPGGRPAAEAARRWKQPRRSAGVARACTHEPAVGPRPGPKGGALVGRRLRAAAPARCPTG